jgi:hypothetical protein
MREKHTIPFPRRLLFRSPALRRKPRVSSGSRPFAAGSLQKQQNAAARRGAIGGSAILELDHALV